MAWSVRKLVRAWCAKLVFAHLRQMGVESAGKAGLVPLPWVGPRDEIVLVPVDERQRMIALPIVCRTPGDMLDAMERYTPTRARILRAS